MVGGRPEQEENYPALRNDCPGQLCLILGLIFNRMNMVKMIYAFLVLPVMLCACSLKTEEKKEVKAVQTNEYPEILLTLESDEKLSAKQLKGKNVFVLFQPDCDHCQEEAIQIGQRLEEFKDYTLYFISSAPMQEITAFAKTFGLDNKPQVKFAWTNTEGVLTYYGPIQTPSIYVYRDGKLRQKFNGQTEIDTILKAL